VRFLAATGCEDLPVLGLGDGQRLDQVVLGSDGLADGGLVAISCGA